MRHEVVHTDDIFGSAMSMFLIDSILYIEDHFHRDTSIWGFHIGKNQVTKTCAPKGRGPGEVNTLSSNIQYFPKEKRFMAYDPNHKKIIEYNDSLPSFSEYRLPVPDSVFKNNFIQDIIKTGNYYVCMGTGADFGNGKRFIVTNTDFKFLKTFEGYPPIANILPKDIQEICQYGDEIHIKPDGSRLVFGSYIGGILEIFDLKSIPDSLPLIMRKLYYHPVYEKDKSGNIYLTENTQCGFENIYVTDHAIYTLMHDPSHPDLFFPNKLVVFNWQGKWMKTYCLDCMVHALCVDENKQKIYAMAFSEEKSFHLVIFPFSDL